MSLRFEHCTAMRSAEACDAGGTKADGVKRTLVASWKLVGAPVALTNAIGSAPGINKAALGAMAKVRPKKVMMLVPEGAMVPVAGHLWRHEQEWCWISMDRDEPRDCVLPSLPAPALRLSKKPE